MLGGFKTLDRVLRGDVTTPEQLGAGRIELPVFSLAVVTLVLGAVFGACIGLHAVIHPGVDVNDPAAIEQAEAEEADAAAQAELEADGMTPRERYAAGGASRSGARGGDDEPERVVPVDTSGKWMQPIASGLKVPLLFLLTLLVTLPSLYVFNALVGSRLTLASVQRLLLAMVAVMLAVAASLGPILVFFAISTESYPFMTLLVVLASAVGGTMGLVFLLRTMDRLVRVQRLNQAGEEPAGEAPADGTPGPVGEVLEPAPDPGEPPADGAPAGASEPLLGETYAARRAKALERAQASTLQRTASKTDASAAAVFKVWVLVFALVGGQMAWVLRPFLGAPHLPFAWFRPRESNFFEAVLRAIAAMLGVL